MKGWIFCAKTPAQARRRWRMRARAMYPLLPAQGSRWERSGRNGLPFPNGRVPGTFLPLPNGGPRSDAHGCTCVVGTLSHEICTEIPRASVPAARCNLHVTAGAGVGTNDEGLLGGSGGWSRPPQTSGQVGMSMMYSCYVPPWWKAPASLRGMRRPSSRPLANPHSLRRATRKLLCPTHSSEGHISGRHPWHAPISSVRGRVALPVVASLAVDSTPGLRRAPITPSFHRPGHIRIATSELLDPRGA